MFDSLYDLTVLLAGIYVCNFSCFVLYSFKVKHTILFVFLVFFVRIFAISIKTLQTFNKSLPEAAHDTAVILHFYFNL